LKWIPDISDKDSASATVDEVIALGISSNMDWLSSRGSWQSAIDILTSSRHDRLKLLKDLLNYNKWMWNSEKESEIVQ